MSTSQDQLEDLVLKVGAPAHGGHCVARPLDDPSGRVVFVRHALPGEVVRARLTQRSSKVWRADVTEVLTASPDRVAPVWPEAGAGGVGGGELSHVALGAQRTWKRWVLADCLRRVGGEEVAAAVLALPESSAPGGVPVEPMPSEQRAEASSSARERSLAGTGTRTRVELTADSQGRPGMHGFRSASVLAVRDLPLAVTQIQKLGLTERSLWRKHLNPGTRLQAVAPSAGEPVVVLTHEGRGRRGGAGESTVLTGQGRSTGRRRVDEVVDASGLGLGELSYSVHADGFWQVHRDAPSVLVDRVVRACLAERPTASGSGTAEGGAPERLSGAGTRVLELYSGAGLLTLPLAGLGCEIRTLEGDEQAVRDARRTLHHHDDARLHVGRVTAEAVSELGSFDGRGTDVVVLDPPRQGAGREVVEAVCALAPKRVVLVACDPAALARDLGTFLHGGYAPAAMSALDMFPHTHHFETVVVLECS